MLCAAPPPAPTPATDPPATEMAAVAPREPVPRRPETGPPPSASAANEKATRILFEPGDAALPAAAATTLGALAEQVKGSEGSRLQVRAYAGGDSASASVARRLSLSRALAVRLTLIEAGVSSTRIDVRALGAKFETGPADRVDIVVVN